jgi:adenylate kinase family enzyme
MRSMRRVSVIGTSGVGKTRLARMLAGRLAVPHIELDALFHGPGWQPREPEDFRRDVDAATGGDGWVVDGNYHHLVQDTVLARADTVVWLDLPRAVVMWQVVSRTLLRIALRREL